MIGSNKQKQEIIRRGVVPRLINLLIEPKTPTELKIHVAYTIGSIAKGQDDNRKDLIDSGVIPVLLNSLVSTDPKLIEACLCGLKTLFAHTDSPLDMIYADANIVPHLISLMSLSTANQISVATILTNACKVSLSPPKCTKV